MNNNKGFTLIELIAVLMILGVLIALTIPKIITLDKTAERRIVETGLRELNAREGLYFAKYMLEDGNAGKYEGMTDGRLDGGFDELTIVYGDTNYKLVFRGTAYKVNRVITRKPHYWSMTKP